MPGEMIAWGGHTSELSAGCHHLTHLTGMHLCLPVWVKHTRGNRLQGVTITTSSPVCVPPSSSRTPAHLRC